MGVMVEVLPGMLLVATPGLLDPNFSDSVVLILDVDPEGTVGVVINRPSDVAVDDVLSPWGALVTDPDRLFIGGPVSQEGALAVAALRPETVAPPGFRAVSGALGILDLDTPCDEVADALGGLRIFVGYAGWSAGQLQREIEEGSWYVVPGETPDAFRQDTTHLWRDVLRRQPGDLAWHSTRPLDPELN
jgi:putative transcriptional regulator